MRTGRTVVAATLIIAGAMYLLAALSDFDAGSAVADWWPLVLVGFGLVQYAVDRTSAYGSLVLAGIGALLLVFTTGIVGGSVWAFILPLLLVLGGVALLMPSSTGSATSADTDLAAFCAFGTRTVRSTATGLTSAEATVIAGGLTIDLTSAQVTGEATIRVLAILGGSQIIVPDGWRIRLTGVPLLGGWDDTTRKDGISDESPVLNVRVVAVLAGVETRHAARWG